MAISKIEERANAIKDLIEDVYKANGQNNVQASAIYLDEWGNEILLTPYRYADPVSVTVYHNGNVCIILRSSRIYPLDSDFDTLVRDTRKRLEENGYFNINGNLWHEFYLLDCKYDV